jgi:HAD superfamily hydrolase (TIGR01509 family)
LGNTKDGYFNDALHTEGAKVYDSTVETIKKLKAEGIKIGVASSSKNCRTVLDRANLTSLFDGVLDGVDLETEHIKGKPAPDMFLDCLMLTCENTGIGKVEPGEAILVEDAQSGVQAGSRGHFGLVLGIDRGGNREALKKGGAHVVVNDFSEVDLPKLDKWIEAQKHKAAQ